MGNVDRVKLPNWFRIAWWTLLLGLVTTVVVRRYPALVAGSSATSDVLVILVWVALALAPVFQEIKLPGIALKQKLEELKNDVVALRQVVSNSVEFRAQFINVPAPPDAQLPQIAAQLVRLLEPSGLTQQRTQEAVAAFAPSVPEDALLLFRVRFEIDRQVRRVWVAKMGPDRSYDRIATVAMAQILAFEGGFLDRALASAIRELYAVTSPAVHGEDPSPAKVAFVRDVSPRVLAALQAIV